MSVAEVHGLVRGYRAAAPVLKGVDMTLRQGEIAGLLGRNGAGKTTLIRVLMGMLRPQQGEVRVLGLDPFTSAVEVRRRIGYVSEDQVLPAHFRVEEVLELHRRLFPTWDGSFEKEMVARFAIPQKPKIRSLSKGQARQVALLCAAAHRPELLLLDEPGGGLDPAARREFLEMAIRLLAEEGTTVLFSSHHMQDVERLAGRLILLEDGRVMVDEDIDAVREGYCVAVLPQLEAEAEGRLRSLGCCLRVHHRSGTTHAVLRSGPEEGRAMLEQATGSNDMACRSMSLEDLFVELVGGQAS